jgi:hypothetical protein
MANIQQITDSFWKLPKTNRMALMEKWYNKALHDIGDGLNNGSPDAIQEARELREAYDKYQWKELTMD